MANRRMKIGAVIYEYESQRYRKADPLRDFEGIEWAVYVDGSIGETYPTAEAARKAIREAGDL